MMNFYKPTLHIFYGDDEIETFERRVILSEEDKLTNDEYYTNILECVHKYLSDYNITKFYEEFKNIYTETSFFGNKPILHFYYKNKWYKITSKNPTLEHDFHMYFTYEKIDLPLKAAIRIFNSEDIIKYLKERGIDSIILA